jgi:hypothetical protein
VESPQPTTRREKDAMDLVLGDRLELEEELRRASFY